MGNSESLRILIADSSPTYKKMFRQAAMELDKDAVVVSVSEGEEALRDIRSQDYDVIIADAEIPGLDAFKFLNDITSEAPKALVLITARPGIANSRLFAEALAKGATDHLIKPIYNSYNENLDVIKNKMAEIFKILNNEHRKNNRCETDDPSKQKKAVRKTRIRPGVVLIAASTGGPMALKNILSKLNADFPAPILVVQHMPAHFTETMTNHLNQNSMMTVKIAESRESVAAGTVYIAPGGIHMKLDGKNKIYFDGSPPIHGVRPSADALFDSVADYFQGTDVLVVILTGMGSDGRKGLVKLKETRNCYCLAQSEKTCVVYGMPRSAIETGLADKIVDLDEMSREIESFSFNFISQEKS